MYNFLWPPWTIAHQTSLSMEFSRQEYWGGSHFLLQGIFLNQRWNIGLLHCRHILYHLSHQESLYFPLIGKMAFETHDSDFQKRVLVKNPTENDGSVWKMCSPPFLTCYFFWGEFYICFFDCQQILGKKRKILLMYFSGSWVIVSTVTEHLFSMLNHYLLQSQDTNIFLWFVSSFCPFHGRVPYSFVTQYSTFCD